MALKQQMKIANEKAQKNILLRGNVPKSSVRRGADLLFLLLGLFDKGLVANHDRLFSL